MRNNDKRNEDKRRKFAKIGRKLYQSKVGINKFKIETEKLA